MSENQKVIARFTQGNAQVLLGARSLEIEQSSQGDRKFFCPVELVSAALGS